MINYKLLMEAVPFGQFYKTPAAWGYNLIVNPFLPAEGVKNLSVGYKFHLSFIIYHLQFIIKQRTVPLAAGGKKRKKDLVDEKYVPMDIKKLSPWQIQRIDNAKKQIEQGNFLTNAEAYKVVDE